MYIYIQKLETTFLTKRLGEGAQYESTKIPLK